MLASCAADDAASVTSAADETASVDSRSSKATTSPDGRSRVTVNSAKSDRIRDRARRRTGTANVISVHLSGRAAASSAKQGAGSASDRVKHQRGLTTKQVDQLIRAFNLLAQVCIESITAGVDGLRLFWLYVLVTLQESCNTSTMGMSSHTLA